MKEPPLPCTILLLALAGCSSPSSEGRDPSASARPSVHHILLEIKEMDRSIAFYRDQLGFRVKSNSGEFAMLEGGNLDIALWEKRWDWEAPPVPGERRGWGIYPHLEVPDVKAAVQRLKKAGCRIVQEPREYNTFTEAFVADPDGYTWALIRMAD